MICYFRRYSDEGWKSFCLVPCPWNFLSAIWLMNNRPSGFFHIYRLKVKNLYKFLIGSTTYWKIQYIFLCLALSPRLVGRLRCISINRFVGWSFGSILEYSWTQCTVFVEIVWGRIRVTQWSRKFDRWLTWAICASCTA